MHVLTMEGLLGAGVNAKLVDTPMRVAGAAERKGDTGAMEQALGYAKEVTEKAEAYQKKTEEGMKKEAKDREKDAEKVQESLVEKRKEEKEELEARIQKESETGNVAADVLEVNETGKRLSEKLGEAEGAERTVSAAPAQMGDSIYTEAGEVIQMDQPEAKLSVLA